jgi:hypothetical protein
MAGYQGACSIPIPFVVVSEENFAEGLECTSMKPLFGRLSVHKGLNIRRKDCHQPFPNIRLVMVRREMDDSFAYVWATRRIIHCVKEGFGLLGVT